MRKLINYKHYPEVIKDIKREFNDVTFIDLFNRNYRLQDAGNFRLIKIGKLKF